MCAVLGILVKNEGESNFEFMLRSPNVSIICANHVSVLDHLAVDLVEPCVLPSVWDIPSVIRWCFGYLDFGARDGHAELVRRVSDYLGKNDLPVLSFPEGAITSGRVGILRFKSMHIC
ncbi:hypothetical protein DICVIV_04798 [Dictyocaulus viviparus]|uniref:Phospholipid/glycerol acyltransferase domain-containing protein n=1 Tax=Dictyocaulus viviparus TaxID=29172 RepID=A0A0D8Y3D0_DICVI|nr:hypothetical protein DICVIV_04798 [Dictyocaulus viviparus]